MRSALIVVVLACIAQAPPALAQAPSGSRLDDVVKSGKLRVCTPAHYKPSGEYAQTAARWLR
jgi:hypothetical protein